MNFPNPKTKIIDSKLKHFVFSLVGEKIKTEVCLEAEKQSQVSQAVRWSVSHEKSREEKQEDQEEDNTYSHIDIHFCSDNKRVVAFF